MSLLDLAGAIGRASIVGGLAAIVAGMCAAAWRRRIPASLRAWIWWLVAAHFVVALVPTLDLTLPSFAPGPPVVLAPVRVAAERTGVLTTRVAEDVWESGRASESAFALPLALGVWLAGILVSVILQLLRFGRIEHVWKEAGPYEPARFETAILPRAQGRHVPEIRVTSELAVPLTLAGWRPRILLPLDCLTLPAESRRLVLAHECAHIARRDLLLGWLPAAAEVLFWFHPLARWAVREYGQAREEACDTVALLRTQASPRSYGELLVHFGVAPGCIPSTASYGSPTRSALLRRLLMLDSTSSRWGRIAGAALIVVAALSLAPLRLQAHDDRSSRDDKGSPETPAELEIERFAYLLVRSDGTSMSGAMKMGDGYKDHERAREAQKRMGGGQIWWFRLDRTQYGLDDPETLAAVLAVLQKQDELYERTVGEFDHNLELLAGRMEQLHPKVEQLEDRKMQLEEKREALEEDRKVDERSQAELERRVQEIDRSREEIEREREPLSREQEQISREMETLTERREATRLVYERQELELRSQLRRIAEDAVRRGVARKL
jgi:beta-lactamase regulating signal transducer with metallopeptidase domain/prefoldin subunit 5